MAEIDLFFDERDKLAANDASFDACAFVVALQAAIRSGELSVSEAAGELPDMLESPLPGVPEAGRSLLTELAQTHNPCAMHNLAVCLLHGDGGPVDAVRARTLLEAVLQQPASTDEERAGANVALAECYRDGVGGAVDLPAAVSLFEEAARLGSAIGAYEAGVAWQGNRGSAVKLPNSPDYAKAAEFYEKGQTYHRCATNLALLHVRSLLPTSSASRGVALLREAARQGDEIALANLRHYRELGKQCAAVLAELETR